MIGEFELDFVCAGKEGPDEPSILFALGRENAQDVMWPAVPTLDERCCCLPAQTHTAKCIMQIGLPPGSSERSVSSFRRAEAPPQA